MQSNKVKKPNISHTLCRATPISIYSYTITNIAVNNKSARSDHLEDLVRGRHTLVGKLVDPLPYHIHMGLHIHCI